MDWWQIIEYLIIGSVSFVLGRLASIVLYKICLFTLFRVIVGGVLLAIALVFLFHREWLVGGVFLLCISEWIKQWYLYTQSSDFRDHKRHISNIVGLVFKPVTLLLGAGVKTGQYMAQVVDGTVSAKRKLKQERAEFESEKAWFESEKQKQAEEWEEIKKAWDELLREREAFERQKAGEGKQEQRKEQSKGYEKSKAKSEQSKQQDRYFSEFASFNLNDFAKNDPYKVLGVDRNTEKKEVLKAYKRLMMRFHPDKFASEPLEKVKEANKIASLLNWAKGQVV